VPYPTIASTQQAPADTPAQAASTLLAPTDAPGDAPAPAAPASSSSTSSTETTREPAPPLDLDDLARRVYGQVRTQLRPELLIDRERAGLLTDFR
jgi:hypothetical protein